MNESQSMEAVFDKAAATSHLEELQAVLQGHNAGEAVEWFTTLTGLLTGIEMYGFITNPALVERVSAFNNSVPSKVHEEFEPTAADVKQAQEIITAVLAHLKATG